MVVSRRRAITGTGAGILLALAGCGNDLTGYNAKNAKEAAAGTIFAKPIIGIAMNEDGTPAPTKGELLGWYINTPESYQFFNKFGIPIGAADNQNAVFRKWAYFALDVAKTATTMRFQIQVGNAEQEMAKSNQEYANAAAAGRLAPVTTDSTTNNVSKTITGGCGGTVVMPGATVTGSTLNYGNSTTTPGNENYQGVTNHGQSASGSCAGITPGPGASLEIRHLIGNQIGVIIATGRGPDDKEISRGVYATPDKLRYQAGTPNESVEAFQMGGSIRQLARRDLVPRRVAGL